jgi:hypothetical protein
VGLIDRAFGADKNSMLVHRICFHWAAVKSHYENFLKENDVPEEQKELLLEIIAACKRVTDEVTKASKGFGFVDYDKNLFGPLLGDLAALHSRLTLVTDKPRWLPQAIAATLDIVNGNKRVYQQNQWWFR